MRKELLGDLDHEIPVVQRRLSNILMYIVFLDGIYVSFGRLATRNGYYLASMCTLKIDGTSRYYEAHQKRVCEACY